MDMNMYMPVRLFTGEGCVRKNGGKIAETGKRCLIITGQHAARACGAYDDVISVLEENDMSYALYDGIGQNPKLSDCMEAALVAGSLEADMIIGIGGGSPLDAAKCTAVLAANPGMDQETLYKKTWANKPLPVICVGTTAGTGSEVTKVAVITNLQGMKKSINDDRIFPVLSFGDPLYTRTLPEFFTLSTAIDALAHCTESYFCRTANEISQCYSVRGIRILIKAFNRILEEGFASVDMKLRTELYNASIYGGLAIHVTGTCMPHSVGYFLSEDHGIAHGTACAQFLPDFLDHNQKEVPALCETFYEEIGMDRDAFLELLSKVTPQKEIIMTEEEVKALHPRWVNNASIGKIWGEFTPDMVDAMLTRKYVR